jgi:hypothetical protein
MSVPPFLLPVSRSIAFVSGGNTLRQLGVVSVVVSFRGGLASGNLLITGARTARAWRKRSIGLRHEQERANDK